MSEIIEPFHLTDNDGNLTLSDGAASAWIDIWKYQVPRGTELILSPGDTFSSYLEDASAEVSNHTAKAKIEVRDPAEGEASLVFGPAAYQSFKEFQDDDLVSRLRMLESIRVPSRYWVVISVYDDGVIDESDSAFDLVIHRVRAGVA